MINPSEPRTDYLEFKCDKCDDIFHHTVGISDDAPSQTDAQRYDIRNWTIMRIDLQCPSCGDEASFKLLLRPDLKQESD